MNECRNTSQKYFYFSDVHSNINDKTLPTDEGVLKF